jgi:cellulose synthase/poly-beta-1,6-N-acetylglucosamine synthase-like glycosyltransferase
LQLKPFTIANNYSPSTKFSIIIPARNEEENIEKCLQSIIQQNYPSALFEVIVIDDHSTDNTSFIVEDIKKKYTNIKLLKLSDLLNGKQLNAYKKKAIEIAIEISSGEWIITTDADCIMLQDWLKNYDAFIQQNNAVFIAAPVAFTYTKTILSIFQYLDFLTLQGITAAAVSAGFHSMCNGANLAYKKTVFFEVNGFAGIDNIASGDDMLLMNKIKKKYPTQIGFLFSKDAIVSTAPMPTWGSFINQRIRWASKADRYKDKNILGVLLLVYFFNLLLLVILCLSLIKPVLIIYWLIVIAVKALVELPFIIPVEAFFGETFVVSFILLQPFHIAYTVIAGWLGKFGTYQWKNRKVK